MFHVFFDFLSYMCKKSIIYISFFCSVFFLSPVYSAGVNNCNPKYISEKLLELGLSPTIRNNTQLLNGIEHEYGALFTSELIKKHPFLEKEHSKKIDLETLKWLTEIGFFGKLSPGTQYLFSPFYEKSDQSVGAKLMSDRLVPLTYNKISAHPIILNEAHLNSLDTAFYDNGKYDVVVNTLLNNFKKTEHEAKEIAKVLYKKIFKNKHFIVGKDDLENISGHTVMILGHCNAGRDQIGDGVNMMTYKEVVKSLIKSGIPPSVNFTLLHCGAANGNVELKTELSKSELITLFINRKVKTIIGDPKDSYAYKFSKELFESWPEFSGTITAPYGGHSLYTKASITRDPESSGAPKNHNLRPIYFIDKNGKSVHFDRSELRVIYKRENFPIDNNKDQGF